MRPRVGQAVASGIETRPETPMPIEPMERSVVRSEHPYVNVTPDAAHVLVETLFAGTHQRIPGVRYSIAYKLAEGRTGGDIVDVFHYDNDHVSFAIADISGKGSEAAVQAALIKYGIRALASVGLTPENVAKGLNRLYLENSAFNNTTDTFATVFFALVDTGRRFLHYTNAGHEPVFIVRPDGCAVVLDPTAPIVGVFEEESHVFKDSIVDLETGSLLIATTDGVTEARNAHGEQYGMERLAEMAVAYRGSSEAAIAKALLAEVESFSCAHLRDDIAILVCRFL